jgi:Family of unknown function (DUF5906)
MPKGNVFDLFGDPHKAENSSKKEAPPDPNDSRSADSLKEFKDFVDAILLMSPPTALAEIQTEKSIEILARMKINSASKRSNAKDIAGLFATILEYSKELFSDELDNRKRWLSRIYRKAKELLPEFRNLENPDEFMLELNKKHAIVPLDGERVIVEVATNERAISKMKLKDFTLAYSNRFTKDVNGKNVITLSKYWLESAARPNYAYSVFDPKNVITPPDCFNWWRGFAIKPRKGVNIDDVLEYALLGLCSNNNDYFNQLIKWSAHIFQKPWEKPGTSLVIRSDEEGTGKSFWPKILSMLMDGDDGTKLYFSFSNPKFLTGDFSGHLDNNLLLHSEEAFSAESRKEDSIIKNIITDDYISINPKGLQARFIKSYHRVIFTGNPIHIIKVSVHGRRFFVLEASDKYRENTEFFGNLSAKLANGGLEALMYYFMHDVDLRDFNPRVALKTEYLMDQQIESFDLIENFWWNLLNLGELPFDVESHKRLGGKFYVIKRSMVNFFNRSQKNAARKENINEVSFGRHFSKFFYSKTEYQNGKPAKMMTDQKTVDGGYNAYHIPSLREARQLFENHIHRKYDWNDKIEWTLPPYNTD